MTELKAPAQLQTLGQLRNFIDKMDVPENQKAQLRSAIKRADELVGHGCLDLAADARMIFAKLEGLSPAMAGLSPQAFANLKSRLRAAFRLAGSSLKTPRPKSKLMGEWQALNDKLTTSEQRRLSRFLRFSCREGWTLKEIGEERLEAFGTHLRDEAMLGRWKETYKKTIQTWNAVTKRLPGRGLALLTPPPRKRTPYWLADKEFPEGFRRDLAEFLTHLGSPKGFMGPGDHAKLEPGTINQYRYAMITLASALVGSGMPVKKLTSLAALVNARSLECALRHLHQRFQGKVTRSMGVAACRARKAADWAGLPPEEMKKLNDLVSQVQAELPRKRGLTDKNRKLLNRLDDQRFVDAVVLLPFTFRKRAQSAHSAILASSYARAAIAVELLLTCGMRRANLVSLELGKTIRKVGSGKEARWVIEILEDDVKNGEPLRFTLQGETVELLEWYLDEWRPKLSSVANSWLFPRETGKLVDPRHLSNDVAKKCERELGTRITLHQFRHISAEIYLRQHPEGLGTVSQHLAHRDANTTRTYYSRSKQREASKRYQDLFMSKREESTARQRPPRRHRRPKPAFSGEDMPLGEDGIEWL